MKEASGKFGSPMDLERLGLPKDFWVRRPAGVDLFLCGNGGESFLPTEVAGNRKLLEEAAQRRRISGNLGKIFERVEDLNLDVGEVLSRGLVKPKELANLYQELTEFIEVDDNNDRIILYLPFQILPDLNTSKKQPIELVIAQERFAQAYKDAWIRLLFESEVRASFVDGDVLEPGLGEPVRIRKAGHLAPEVLKRGLISPKEILKILTIVNEDELLQSLTEGIAVARDCQLFNDEEWSEVQAIGRIKPAVAAVLAKMVESSRPEVPKPTNREFPDFLESIVSDLEVELAQIEVRHRPGSKERIKWLKQVERDQAIEQFASEVAQGLLSQKLGIKEVRLLCQRSGYEDGCRLVGIRSFIRAAEKLSTANLSEARELAASYKPLVEELWRENSLTVKDEIISGLAHWQRGRIVDQEFINGLGIKIPDLASPFPVNLEALLTTDLRPLVEAVGKIKKNPDLAGDFFPLILVFGSRSKGYATLTADYDLAVFTKPGTVWEKRKEIMEGLRQQVPELKTVGKISEFWLEKKEGGFGFRQTPEDAYGVIRAPQVDLILGGVWLGQEGEAEEIGNDLLQRYLDLSRFKEHKDQARIHLLRQVEDDTLQFRLLHKGYRRFYPNRREEGSKNADLIDWQSDFWDPGYRRVASLLFLSRVFLPDLNLG